MTLSDLCETFNNMRGLSRQLNFLSTSLLFVHKNSHNHNYIFVIITMHFIAVCVETYYTTVLSEVIFDMPNSNN